MNNNNYDFFLSYSRDVDIKLPEQLIENLEQYALRIWWDYDAIVLGSLIQDTFSKVLKESRTWVGAIILIDSTYMKKEWCKIELNYFINNNIPIFPVLIDVNKEYIQREEPRLIKYNFINLNIESRKITNLEYIVDLILDIFLIFYTGATNNSNKNINDFLSISSELPELILILMLDLINTKTNDKNLKIIKIHSIMDVLLAHLAYNKFQLYGINKTEFTKLNTIPHYILVCINIIEQKYNILLNHSILTRKSYQLVDKTIFLLISLCIEDYV